MNKIEGIDCSQGYQF